MSFVFVLIRRQHSRRGEGGPGLRSCHGPLGSNRTCLICRVLGNLKSMWTSTAFIRTWAVSLMTEVVRLQVSVGDETALIYLWQIVPSDA
jgi:hypothetical protein